MGAVGPLLQSRIFARKSNLTIGDQRPKSTIRPRDRRKLGSKAAFHHKNLKEIFTQSCFAFFFFFCLDHLTWEKSCRHDRAPQVRGSRWALITASHNSDLAEPTLQLHCSPASYLSHPLGTALPLSYSLQNSKGWEHIIIFPLGNLKLTASPPCAVYQQDQAAEHSLTLCGLSFVAQLTKLSGSVAESGLLRAYIEKRGSCLVSSNT